MSRGKFIVIYGANNLGKSTQAKLMVDELSDQGIHTVSIKYPIYHLEPTGPKINAILRGKEKLPEEMKMQNLFVQNRKDYQPELEALLGKGTWVITEDYKGTGIAWGLVRGLKLEDLEKINEGLLDEDLALCLYGERFKDAIEQGHINEEDEKIWDIAQKKHLFLADRYGWIKVNANESIEEIHAKIWDIVKEKLSI